MIAEQAKNIEAINRAPVSQLLDAPDDATQYVNTKLKMPKSEASNELFWFSTPQKPGDATQHTPVQQRILQELIALQELEQLNPQEDQELRYHFLSNFDWTDSTLDKQSRQVVEDLLIHFENVFAKHRFDIGINYDIKIKLPPVDENPASIQNLPTPINLIEDITVELAPIQKNSNITILSFRGYYNSVSPNLRKINNLTADDYINNSNLVSTLTVAAQQMAGIFLF